MARNPKWTPETDEPPADAPKNRDQLVQEHRQRKVDEPAAAPRETDAEAGRQTQPPHEAAREEDPVPQTEPVSTHMVAGSGRDPAGAPREPGETPRDVRAGPGDAGASDTPRKATKPARVPRQSGSRVMLWVGLGLVLLLIIVFVGLP